VWGDEKCRHMLGEEPEELSILLYGRIILKWILKGRGERCDLD
jgi:hypothetical protein